MLLSIILFTVFIVVLYSLATFVFKDIRDKVTGLIVVILALLGLLLSLDIHVSKGTRESLIKQYPVLEQAIQEEETKKELEILLERQQKDNKRYIELLGEL